MPGKDDPVLQTIFENCSDPQFNVSALAEALGVSTSHLCELAYSHYDMKLHQLIETVRLERAIKLLATDGDRIALVRKRVGYAYTKTFREAFKKRLDLTPQQCKERLSGAKHNRHEIKRLLKILWG